VNRQEYSRPTFNLSVQNKQIKKKTTHFLREDKHWTTVRSIASASNHRVARSRDTFYQRDSDRTNEWRRRSAVCNRNIRTLGPDRGGGGGGGNVLRWRRRRRRWIIIVTLRRPTTEWKKLKRTHAYTKLVYKNVYVGIHIYLLLLLY